MCVICTCQLLTTIHEPLWVLCIEKCHRLMGNLPWNCGFCATNSPNFIIMDSKLHICMLVVRWSFWDIICKDRTFSAIALRPRSNYSQCRKSFQTPLLAFNSNLLHWSAFKNIHHSVSMHVWAFENNSWTFVGFMQWQMPQVNAKFTLRLWVLCHQLPKFYYNGFETSYLHVGSPAVILRHHLSGSDNLSHCFASP